VTAAGREPFAGDMIPPHLQALLAVCRAELGPFASHGRVLPSTTSTNDDALRWAADGAPEGAWVVAAEQRAGRGRRGRVWASPPGAGLYLSVIFRPALGRGGADPATGLLSVMAGVATVEAIADAIGVRATLKWPNDLVVEGRPSTPPPSLTPLRAGPPTSHGTRKLAGILAEGAIAGSSLSAVVVGIGVNVRPSAYPPDVAARAVSLEELVGRAVDADGVLVAILGALHARRRALAADDGPARLLEAWRAWSPSAVGARIRWDQQGRVCEGVTAGVDETGALRVRTAAGEARLVAGEVVWA
jgi:BirA family biotin operon repressor/biotin-[acetyl-CoA-carboxylase] ligase